MLECAPKLKIQTAHLPAAVLIVYIEIQLKNRSVTLRRRLRNGNGGEEYDRNSTEKLVLYAML